MTASQPLSLEGSIQQMHGSSRRVVKGICGLVAVYMYCWWAGTLPHPNHAQAEVTPAVESAGVATDMHAAIADAAPSLHGIDPHGYVPGLVWVTPFALLLIAIAIFPLMKFTEHWWHHNRNRFLVAVVLSGVTLLYYTFLHPGGIDNHFTGAHGTAAGMDTAMAVFSNAILHEYIPFIILLFSLYVISGGINLTGDLRAHPVTNCAFLGIGAGLASFIGTTGAAMVLIRPLLATNAERRHKTHTVLFFIFMVCNCGGLLLPIGDPPLFLGYLRGVPFGWTMGLWPFWLAVNLVLLAVYYVWDRRAYGREAASDIVRDETQIQPLRLHGKVNIALILGVVLAVAFVVPGRPLLGTGFSPPPFFREAVMLLVVAVSLIVTEPRTRVRNRFDYVAIVEVAALFCGIFICMQVPIEILNAKGQALGIKTPTSFFWMTGLLSSFLDNAPTYVVFFETAKTLPAEAAGVVALSGGTHIVETFLIAISLGAVFMGANTYIGNGPNFMVKSIAEQSGVKMPSFFGYMGYSCLVLVPIFAVTSLFL